jgi:hypothetical protein
MSICGFTDCEKRVDELKVLKEEINELKIKNDLLKTNYDELMGEYKFYENIILDAMKENNLLQDNGTKISEN